MLHYFVWALLIFAIITRYTLNSFDKDYTLKMIAAYQVQLISFSYLVWFYYGA
jgi:hypothetical protein